jgi:glycosyltransferase involved in cell wall biosynthesis
MSNYALRQFKKQHANQPHLANLLAKTEILYPALSPKGVQPKQLGRDKLRLLFVGKDYFRKGGPVLVRAHTELRRRGVPVETTIVSSLHWSETDYVGPPDSGSVRFALKELDASDIILHRGLPNGMVQELMRTADYLVLPTFHDTFGYVSIEAMHAATPVIATATAAQTEIVSDGCSGILLPFDNDPEVGKWTWLYGQKRPDYLRNYWDETSRLARVLAERLQQVWEAPHVYGIQSSNALSKALQDFNSKNASARLEMIYESATRDFR